MQLSPAAEFRRQHGVSVFHEGTVSITVERTPDGWEVFAYDADGDGGYPLKASTEAVARLHIAAIRCGRRNIPVTWLRGH